MVDPTHKRITIIIEDLSTKKIKTVECPLCIDDSVSCENTYKKRKDSSPFDFATLERVDVEFKFTAFPNNNGDESFWCTITEG